MSFISAYYTDIGPCRDMNQDALCIKAVEYNGEEFIMCAVCDGMGGLSDGEAASSYTVISLSDWFDSDCKKMIKEKKSILEIRRELDIHIHSINNNLNNYSAQTGKILGTTMTAMFFFPHINKTLTAHVGDTRAYKIKDTEISVITDDHSVVGEEVREGIITEEMANSDDRQNQLTKCLGADFDNISYDYIINEFEHNCCYMLCSDGFRKKIRKNEIIKNIAPSNIHNKEDAQNILKNLTETVIKRGENDNITSLIIKIN